MEMIVEERRKRILEVRKRKLEVQKRKRSDQERMQSEQKLKLAVRKQKRLKKQVVMYKFCTCMQLVIFPQFFHFRR